MEQNIIFAPFLYFNNYNKIIEFIFVSLKKIIDKF